MNCSYNKIQDPVFKIGDKVILISNEYEYEIINITYDWQGYRYTLLCGLHVYESHLKKAL